MNSKSIDTSPKSEITGRKDTYLRRFIAAKHFMFNHYWWLAILAAAASICIALALATENRLTVVGSIIATALAYCYFIQQQKLAETLLFKTLFTEFNERYKKISGDLIDITQRKEIKDNSDMRVLMQYFNLCSEEYLFYKQGYIHRDVWTAWCRGILWYLEVPCILRAWQEEEQKDSYYGLSLSVVKAGAE